MITTMSMDRVEFAAYRRKLLADNDRIMLPAVKRALRRYGQNEWWNPILDAAERVFRRVLRQESGITRHSHLPETIEAFRDMIGRNVRRTQEPTSLSISAARLAEWITTAAVNAATVFATKADPEDLAKEWIAMHDDKVRATHKEADGQVVPAGDKFHVDGVKMDYPGQPVGDPALWINCRCVARPAKLNAAQGGTVTTITQNTNSTDATVEFDEQVEEVPVEDVEWEPEPVPWHGILAPEGVTSGDKRRFSKEALTWRDLPLPLSWQKVSDDRHKGSVVVGQITKVWRDGTKVHGSGFWDQSTEADEAFRQVVDGMLRGVSVDVDDVTMEFQAEDGTAADGEDGIATFTQGRICGATLVAIPAFQEAFIEVGDAVTAAGIDKPWDGSAGRFTPEQYRRACILHKCAGLSKDCHSLPIREPSGALNKNAVHAAAARINQVKGASSSQIAAAKSALRGAYRQIGETPPDSLAVEPDAFGRGPGWVTNPEATRRLHDYWVHGPGAAKIRWGEPNDFYRCRTEVGEEIGENSPAKLRFINQICAQWHHDALGTWPGRPNSEDVETLDAEPAPAVLVASADTITRRAEFFENPNLIIPSPLVVTREGHVFGHLATWGTCHIGIGDACITAPESKTNYSYFHTGAVELDDGRTIPVGHITMGGGHADRFSGYRAATAHYDDTGTCVADVVAGEDEFGIWLSGQTRPGLDDEQFAALRAAALSGDWRPIGTGLELVAALCVNVPGFPIPRAELSIAGGVQFSLLAAGVVPPSPAHAGTAQLAAAVADELEMRARKRKMAELRAESNRDRIARLRS